MSTRSIRVTVRGAFDGLTAQQRAELLAEAPQHDFLQTTYTPEGHLSYDIAARPFFTFRFLATVEREQDIPAATAAAEQAARDWCAARGYGCKGVTAQAVDMSQVPLGARQRRRIERASS